MYVFALVLSSLLLCWLNYTPNTILSGWDALHPEFNLGLYLQRIFWGVWQQHQGLGALAVQAQASELGRLWYLWIPFRYGYFWLTLIIGPLGVYKLLGGKIKGFLGGLFYLLNLGTMQHFYLPLEMFATGYAFLPWLFWAVFNKRTGFLVLFFLLSAPMAHTPTLWIVNFAALIIFAFFLDKKWSIKVLLIGLITNSFWLLPSIYYVFTHGAEVANSHISQQFSGKAISVSQEFANLFDIALLRGYLFNWGHFDFTTRQFADLLTVWKNHLNTPTLLAIGYGFFAAVIAGIIASFKNKISLGRAMLPVFLLAVLGLLIVVEFEPLRFPFTKFSLLLMLAFSVYFGIAISYLKKAWIVIPVFLIIYMWPAFKGNLICDCERVQIPIEYQQTFEWFSKQDPDTRIAPFPVDSIYGWGYYDWGYEGAGFRWFGLAQPILDREFDRWNPANENYYWELSQALYSKNLPLFESVLNKYRVNWLLVDGNIINPSSPKALYIDEFEELVSRSKVISPKQQFGKIKIYSFSLRTPTKSFISLVQNLPNVSPSYKWGNLDQGYFDVGDYVSDTKKSPYGDSSDSTPIGSNLDFHLSAIVDQLINIVKGCGGSGLCTRGTVGENPGSPLKYPHTNTSIANIIYQYRTLFTGRSQADIEFDPQELLTHTRGGLVCVECYSTLSHKDGYLITVKAKNNNKNLFWIEDLNSRRAVLETYLPQSQQKTLLSESILARLRADAFVPSLSRIILNPINFFVKRGVNPTGVAPALPSLTNLERHWPWPTIPQSNISYFILPPQESDGLGYAFHADNIEKLEVFKIDYWNLVSKRVGANHDSPVQYLNNFIVEHPNPALYRIDIGRGNPAPTTIILSQSFDPGWVAFGAGEHILVNNWANGWQLTGNERLIYLFYWPQLLEFAGFGVLTIFIIGLIIRIGYSKCVLVIRN